MERSIERNPSKSIKVQVSENLDHAAANDRDISRVGETAFGISWSRTHWEIPDA